MKLFIYILWAIHEYMYLPGIDINNLKMHFLVQPLVGLITRTVWALKKRTGLGLVRQLVSLARPAWQPITNFTATNISCCM